MSNGKGNGKADRRSLTQRENEIVRLWSEGKSNKEVGDKLGVSLETIKAHAKYIFLKLDVHGRTEACHKVWLTGRKKTHKRK